MKKLFTVFPKIFLFLAVFISLSFPFAKVARADLQTTTSWFNQSYKDWYLKVYETDNDTEIFGERYTAAQVQWILYSLLSYPNNTMVGGNTDGVACIMQLPLADVDDCFGAVLQGLDQINPLTKSEGGNILATVTSNPISGIGYLKNTFSKFSIVPEAKAQGAGFELSNSVIQVWRLTRNIAFSLLVIVVIVFAFMIMFRIKINPQTVITVQSALPKIAMTIIFISFSYAIAGLLIDLMYVLLGLIVAFLTSATPSLFHYEGNSALKDWQTIMNFLLNRSIIEIFWGYWYALLVVAFSQFARLKIGIFLIALVIWMVSSIILFVAIIKTIFALLKNFALILLSIITAPLEILFGSIGQGSGIGSWLSKMLSYLAVYPVIGLMILMAHFFAAAAMPIGDPLFKGFDTSENFKAFYATVFPFNPSYNAIGETSWKLPFTLGEEGGANIVWLIVSIFIMTQIPKTIDIIKSIMERKPFDFTTAIGQAMGPVDWVGKQAQGILNVPLSGIRQAASLQTGSWLLRQAQRVVPEGTKLGKAVRSQETALNTEYDKMVHPDKYYKREND